MIIVIDAILSPVKPRGVARYTDELIKGLAKLDKKNTYYVIYGSWMNSYDFLQISQPNFHFIEKKIKSDMVFRNVYKCFVLPLIAKKLHADVFHVTDTSPLIYKTCPVISTIHDLAEFVMPEKYSRLSGFCRRKYLWFQTRLSDQILTVSHYSEAQIEKRFPAAKGKIHVTYNGVDQNKFISDRDKVDTLYAEPYFLYLGGMERSKNVPIIVEAFARLPEEYRTKYQLKLVGEPNTDTPLILETIEKYNLQTRVIVRKYVPEKELISLYRGAFAFIHPSKYEGFGIPIIEAFAAGIPVIAANATCFPEICQNAALLFQPDDASDCTRQMLKLLQSETLRKDLISRGDKRRREFTWERLCIQTLHYYLRWKNTDCEKER